MSREIRKIIIMALLDNATTTVNKHDQLIYTLNEKQTSDFIEDLVKKLTLTSVSQQSELICDCIAVCLKSENPKMKNCKQQVFPNC